MSSTKGPDAGLRKILRDHLKPHGHIYQAVETGTTSAGLPDSHVIGPTGTYWVESKRTLSRTGRVKLEPHQIQWMRKASPWIPTFFAVRLLEGAADGGAADGLAILPGSAVDSLATGGVDSVSALYRTVGAPRYWDWTEIARILSERQLPS